MVKHVFCFLGTATPGVCVDTFDEMRRMGVSGGEQVDVFGYDDCEAECLSLDADECYGFDLGNDDSCWLLMEDKEAEDRTDGTTHYRRIVCQGKQDSIFNSTDHTTCIFIGGIYKIQKMRCQ